MRFSAVLDFHLDEATLAAIRDMAGQITVVSAERIAAEMQIVLPHAARVRAVQLLQETGLLRAILPEADTSALPKSLALLGSLERPTFSLALAVLLHGAEGSDLAEVVGQRWRLARKDTDRVAWLLKHWDWLRGARTQRWSQLQPLLINEGAEELIALHAALGDSQTDDVAFCREQLRRPAEELNPGALLSGEDLIAAGVPRGPGMARLLKAVRVAQLDGEVRDPETALKLIEELRAKPS